MKEQSVPVEFSLFALNGNNFNVSVTSKGPGGMSFSELGLPNCSVSSEAEVKQGINFRVLNAAKDNPSKTLNIKECFK